MKIFLKYFITSFMDFLFPPSCIVCSEYVDTELLVCRNCLNNLELHKNEDKSYISVFKYNHKIKLLVHELKYNNRPELGKIFGREMAKRLSGMIETDNSILLPVPLHKKRLRKRGYNQSEKICEGFSEITQIPQVKNLLARKKNNTSQTKLNAIGRQENVKDIFQSNPTEIKKSTMIFIVDDLITTGATTKEAVKELKKNGFLNIFSLSVATSSRQK